MCSGVGGISADVFVARSEMNCETNQCHKEQHKFLHNTHFSEATQWKT